jgi:hypothetical protein
VASSHPHKGTPSAYVIVPEDYSKLAPQTRAPGVREQVTFRCYIGFDEREPPTVVPPRTGFGSTAMREFAFLFLSQVEQRRRRIPIFSRVAQLVQEEPRSTYRAIYTRLAKNLLPISERYRLSPAPADVEQPRWFEASRRIIQYESEYIAGRASITVVLHMFAPDQSEETERLLDSFVSAMPEEPKTKTIYDPDTDLVMESRLSRQLASKRYCDMVIAPRGTFPPGHRLKRHPFRIVMHKLGRVPPVYLDTEMRHAILISDKEVTAVSEQLGAIDPSVEGDTPQPLPESARVVIDDALMERTDRDWHFIMDEIHTAVERGRALDADLVHSIAKRRYGHAGENYRYSGRPGSGATLESSERIVHSVLDLYKLGADPTLPDDNDGEGPSREG